MEKLTKEDIKGPDAFISSMEVVSHYSFKHRAAIFSTVGVLLLAGVIWAILGVTYANTEEKAQLALFNAEKSLNSIQGDFEKSKSAEKTKADAEKAAIDAKASMAKNKKAKVASAPTPAPVPPEKEALKKPTGVFETDFGKPEALLKNVISDYPKTQASVVATLDLSRLYYDNKKFEAEIPLLENASHVASHPITKALTLNQLGLAYEAKADYAKSIEAWDKIQKDSDLGFMQGEILLKMGLSYEKLNQNDKAEQTYKQVEKLTKDPESVKIAKKYLRILKRDQKT